MDDAYKMGFMKQQRFTIKAAEDLKYPEEVIKKLKNAKTKNELMQIMGNARRKYL